MTSHRSPSPRLTPSDVRSSHSKSNERRWISTNSFNGDVHELICQLPLAWIASHRPRVAYCITKHDKQRLALGRHSIHCVDGLVCMAEINHSPAGRCVASVPAMWSGNVGGVRHNPIASYMRWELNCSVVQKAATTKTQNRRQHTHSLTHSLTQSKRLIAKTQCTTQNYRFVKVNIQY